MAVITSLPRRLLASRGVTLGVGLALLALNLVLVNYLASRHHTRSDWTTGRVYSLSPKTLKVLGGLRSPVQVTVFMVHPDRLPPELGWGSLYHETRELLRRFRLRSPMIRVEYLDVDVSPTRAELLAKRYSINTSDLQEGVVVFSRGKQSKYVPAAAMADFEHTGQSRKLVAYKGESALLGALLTVIRGEQATVCFTTGHGEAPTGSYAKAGYGYIADEVKRDSHRLRVLPPGDLPRATALCQVLVIGGPSRGFAQLELDALDLYLRRGGRMLVLVGPVLDQGVTRYRELGLERLLERWGIRLMNNIVLDRLAVPGESAPMTWATKDGYTDHPVVRSLADRVTVWPLVREVRPVPGSIQGLTSQRLVMTSKDGWAESDLASLRGANGAAPTLDPAVDTRGPVPVAAAASRGATRLVVLGTERGMLNRRLGGIVVRDHNRDLFLGAVAWLAGQQEKVAVGPRSAEHVRLALDEGQMVKVFAVSVLGVPLFILLCGVWIWWRRRR